MAGGPLVADDEAAEAARAEAQRHFQLGYGAQMQGRLEEAVAHYQRSIGLHPTAEAHTFLGWAYSFQGRPDDAIAQCMIAIEVDPEFGKAQPPQDAFIPITYKEHWSVIREIDAAMNVSYACR